MADEHYLDVLQREFTSTEGSFMSQLRTYLRWDKAAFSQLTAAMLECCKAYSHTPEDKARKAPLSPDNIPVDTAPVPRWLAEGFWYLSYHVRDWTTHPAWKETTEPEQYYYDEAYERLFALASWFFEGESMFLDPETGYTAM